MIRLRTILNRWIAVRRGRALPPRPREARRAMLGLDSLEGRAVPASFGFFGAGMMSFADAPPLFVPMELGNRAGGPERAFTLAFPSEEVSETSDENGSTQETSTDSGFELGFTMMPTPPPLPLFFFTDWLDDSADTSDSTAQVPSTDSGDGTVPEADTGTGDTPCEPSQDASQLMTDLEQYWTDVQSVLVGSSATDAMRTTLASDFRAIAETGFRVDRDALADVADSLLTALADDSFTEEEQASVRAAFDNLFAEATLDQALIDQAYDDLVTLADNLNMDSDELAALDSDRSAILDDLDGLGIDGPVFSNLDLILMSAGFGGRGPGHRAF